MLLNCGNCGGPGASLGTLGDLEHYRCIFCGMDWAEPARPNDPEEVETMFGKNWFWEQGYHMEQLRVAGSASEASMMHDDFIHRLMDTDRSQRIQCLEDYNSGRDAFRKEVC